VDKILYQIHLLLTDFEFTNPNLAQNNQTDQMVIRYVKNLINELVKLRNEAIKLDYLKGVDRPDVKDKYIKKWIVNILASIEQPETKRPSTAAIGNQLKDNLSSSTSMNHLAMSQSFVSTESASSNIENLIAYKNKLQQSNVIYIPYLGFNKIACE
jgi:hypothetical protein